MNIPSLTLFFNLFKVLNKADIIKENAVQQCKDEVNIQVRINYEKKSADAGN